VRDEEAASGVVAAAGDLAGNLAHDTKVAFEAAFKTADHGVRFVTHDGQGGNRGRIRTYDGARGFRRDALSASIGQIEIDVVAIARVVFRIDEFEIRSRTDFQAVAAQARFDNLRAADEDRSGDALFDHNLGCTQYAFIFAIGINYALWLFLCASRGKDRLHDEAGPENEAIEAIEISFHVFDRTRRHACFHGGLGHCRGDAENQALIEWRGDDIVRSES